MTVYKHWIWCECMYQLWLYMSIEIGLSVCISYDCIWALNLVWVYVSGMTVYEHWIWLKCMYQLWRYMSIEFGKLVQGYRRGRKFGVFMTNHTTFFFKLNYIANWFKIVIFRCFYFFNLNPCLLLLQRHMLEQNNHSQILIWFLSNLHQNRCQHIVYSWARLNHKVK